MASNYCARADVYAIGLSPEMFRRPPREIEAVDIASGTFTVRSHGLAQNAPIILAVLSSSTLGAPPATVPTGTALGTLYYAQPVSSDLFQLATSPSGSALPILDGGSGVFGIIVDHGVYLDAAIAAASAVIDEHARAHLPPISAPALPVVCAFLAARIYTATHVPGNPQFLAASEGPTWIRSVIDGLLKLWATGVEIVGAVDADPRVPEMGPVAVKLKGRGFLSHDDREELV